MNEIYIISAVLFVVVIVGIYLLKKKSNKKNAGTPHIGGGEPLTNANDSDNAKQKSKTVNFVDAASAASGIIDGQKKKEKQAEEGVKKPVGWVQTESYEEDIKKTVDKETIAEIPVVADEEKQPVKKEKINILVVDDFITVLKLVGTLLKKADYDFITKSNGIEALEYLDTIASLPDLVITDIEMPIMTGTELIEKIKAEKKLASLPILILSSNPEPHIHLLESGLINGVIQKPFNKDEFMDQIKYVVNN